MNKKVKELRIHENDTGSSEIQIGLLTEKIENLSQHIKQFKKDKHSSVGLLKAVNKRKKLLDYLKKNKIESLIKILLVKWLLQNIIEGFFETAFLSLTHFAEESFVCQIMAP